MGSLTVVAASEIEPVGPASLIGIAEPLHEGSDAFGAIDASGRFRRHQRDRRFGPERHKIPHAILLDLPSHEIGFGIAVGGDAQFRFECVTTAVAGRIGRSGAVWRQLLRSAPLKHTEPMKLTDQLRAWTHGTLGRARSREK